MALLTIQVDHHHYFHSPAGESQESILAAIAELKETIMETQTDVAAALNAASASLDAYKDQVAKVITEVQTAQAENAAALAAALAAANVADPAVIAAAQALSASTAALGAIVQQADDIHPDAPAQ